jgi:hypothetical protein
LFGGSLGCAVALAQFLAPHLNRCIQVPANELAALPWEARNSQKFLISGKKCQGQEEASENLRENASHSTDWYVD